MHLPFKGAPEAMTEVIAGRADFYFSPLVNALPLLKDGQLQALAVSGSSRASALPDVPTTVRSWLSELGVQFLGRHVRARKDARRHPRQALCRNGEGACRRRPSATSSKTLGADPMPLNSAQFEALVKQRDRDQHPAGEGRRHQGELIRARSAAMSPRAQPASRRRFLAGAAAAAAGCWPAAFATRKPHPTVSACCAPAPLGAGHETQRRLWPGFDGAVPGPTLRVKRGDELRVRLVNELAEPSAVHWHGVRLPNAMDGVPPLTQPPVAPGASFDYRFRPPDAGTFWYHASCGRQLDAGPPWRADRRGGRTGRVDRDIVLLLGMAGRAGGGAAPVRVNGSPRPDSQ